MSEQAEALSETAIRSPHIVVVGNEKGGSGKTTTAMHVAAALLNEGLRVGTMDLDVRQRSFSRYIENRKIWVGRRAVAMPEHFSLEEFSYNDLALRQRAEPGLSTTIKSLPARKWVMAATNCSCSARWRKERSL